MSKQDHYTSRRPRSWWLGVDLLHFYLPSGRMERLEWLPVHVIIILLGLRLQPGLPRPIVSILRVRPSCPSFVVCSSQHGGTLNPVQSSEGETWLVPVHLTATDFFLLCLFMGWSSQNTAWAVWTHFCPYKYNKRSDGRHCSNPGKEKSPLQGRSGVTRPGIMALQCPTLLSLIPGHLH